MIVGLDLDNTIVCYDEIFYRESLRRRLIPEAGVIRKEEIRDYLQELGRNDLWVELQGYVYGPAMTNAQPFPGVIEFLCKCKSAGIKTYIISHKTEYPYEGAQYSLRDSAREWLSSKGFFNTIKTGLSSLDVFFLPTLQLKVEQVQEKQCTHFVDDLPKFLADAALPENVDKILFDPGNLHSSDTRFKRAESWIDVGKFILLTEAHP